MILLWEERWRLREQEWQSLVSERLSEFRHVPLNREEENMWKRKYKELVEQRNREMNQVQKEFQSMVTLIDELSRCL